MRISRGWRAAIAPVASAVAVTLAASLLVAPAVAAESAPAESPPRVAAARTAAPSTSYLCTGYARCQQAGYPHAGYATEGAQMWWRMYAGHNCTNYVAYRLVQSGMSSERPWSGEGNAWNWGYAMASITDQVPMVGSVAWWDKNVPGASSSGHVAYVERVVSDSEIIISEDSWGGDFSWRRLVKGARGWPTGFIHFNDVTVENIAPPEVLGQPAVGATLEAQPGTWAPAGSYKYRWFVDGTRLPKQNRPTFAPRPAHLDKEIAVRIIGTSAGYQAGTADSSPTPPVEPGTLVAEAAPVIEGIADVDRTLTVSTGSVTPAATSTSIRWLADGAPVPGAAGPSLTLGQAQIGKRITAEVTSARNGYHDHVATSAATEPVHAGEITAQGFALEGEPRIGETLQARPGSFEPAHADVRYTWLRDGAPVPGAVGPSYTLGRADVGSTMSLQVDLTALHYRSLREVVGRTDRVTTTSRLKVRAIGRPNRAVVRVRGFMPGAPRTGPIKVRVGKRVVDAELRRGRARVVVRDLKAGPRRVRVVYVGTPLVARSRAITTVTVTRRPR